MTEAERSPLDALEKWVGAHKSHHCRICIDDGYGATCWRVSLYRKDGEPESVRAAETNFFTGGKPLPGVVFVADGDSDFDWPGLGPTIMAALELAEVTAEVTEGT